MNKLLLIPLKVWLYQKFEWVLWFLHCFYFFCHFLYLVIEHFLLFEFILFNWIVVKGFRLFVSSYLRIDLSVTYIVEYLLYVLVDCFDLLSIKLWYLLVLPYPFFILHHLLYLNFLLKVIYRFYLILYHLIFLNKTLILGAQVLIHLGPSCLVSVCSTHLLDDGFVLNSVKALICFFGLNLPQLFLCNLRIHVLNRPQKLIFNIPTFLIFLDLL